MILEREKFEAWSKNSKKLNIYCTEFLMYYNYLGTMVVCLQCNKKLIIYPQSECNEKHQFEPCSKYDREHNFDAMLG